MNNIIPATLSQILEVYTLVRQFHYERIDAIKNVARKHRVDPQTVRSACTRSIGINIAEFDNLLRQEKSHMLQEMLIQRFPDNQSQLEQFFGDVNRLHEIENPDRISKLVRQLLPDEKKLLLLRVRLKQLISTIKLWEKRTDIPQDVKINSQSGLKKLKVKFRFHSIA